MRTIVVFVRVPVLGRVKTKLAADDDGGTAVGDWLGHDLARRSQGDGDLGERMLASIGAALAGGARHVIVVGTDCPALTAETAERAVDALASADVVIGPALD